MDKLDGITVVAILISTKDYIHDFLPEMIMRKKMSEKLWFSDIMQITIINIIIYRNSTS